MVDEQAEVTYRVFTYDKNQPDIKNVNGRKCWTPKFENAFSTIFEKPWYNRLKESILSFLGISNQKTWNIGDAVLSYEEGFTTNPHACAKISISGDYKRVREASDLLEKIMPGLRYEERRTKGLRYDKDLTIEQLAEI